MSNGKILVVEDDPSIRGLAVDYLRMEGFEVVEAPGGTEALQSMGDRLSFDAVFIDVRMPGAVDGIDVAEQFRQNYPDMPILLCSGYAAQLAPRLAALGPPISFLPKPYTLAELVGIVTRMVGHA